MTAPADSPAPTKVLSISVANKEIKLGRTFSCEFCEISKNTFLQNTSGRLLPEV